MIYIYIKRFRNIVNQEIYFSDQYKVDYDDRYTFPEALTIKRRNLRNFAESMIYENSILQNVNVIVGKSGTGKTNIIQLIGMQERERILDSEKEYSYFLLYEAERKFTIELYNIKIDSSIIFCKKKPNRDYVETLLYGEKYMSIRNVMVMYKFILNNSKPTNIQHINYSDSLRKNEVSILCKSENDEFFCAYNQDRYFENEFSIGLWQERINEKFTEITLQNYCFFLKKYIENFYKDSIKEKISLVIKLDNWAKLIERFQSMNEKENSSDDNVKRNKRNTKSYNIDLDKKRALLQGEKADRYYASIPSKDANLYFRALRRNSAIGIWGLKMQKQYEHIKSIKEIINKFDSQYLKDDIFILPIEDMYIENNKKIAEELLKVLEYYRKYESEIFTEQLISCRFSFISSGECRLAMLIGEIEYLCEKLKENKNISNFIYLIDEPENCMHPELCRVFFERLDIMLREKIKDLNLQIIIATHSPMLLSDVFSDQVIRLDMDAKGNCIVADKTEKEYFASNIHTILADAFFMDYTIGDYSRKFLQEELDWLKKILDQNSLTPKEQKRFRRLKQVVPYIGDPIIKKSFEIFLQQIEGTYD